MDIITGGIPADKTERETRYTFVVVDAANDPDSVYARLRQLLKQTLRGYQLRCLECRADESEVQL